VQSQPSGQDGNGFLPDAAESTHPHPNPGVSASLRRSAGAERYSAKPLLHPLEGEGAGLAPPKGNRLCRLQDSSNFYCLPGRAGGPPLVG
jgi:hypothetical protein